VDESFNNAHEHNVTIGYNLHGLILYPLYRWPASLATKLAAVATAPRFPIISRYLYLNRVISPLPASLFLNS